MEGHPVRQIHCRRILSSLFLAILVVPAVSSQARATDPRRRMGALIDTCPECHKCLSKDVYYSDFYGYYRTCWRRWPGGQPPCPVEIVSELPKTESGKPAAMADQNVPELLPTPRPETDKK